MKTKTCTKCNQTLSLDDFYDHKQKKDGKQSHCKCCMKNAALAKVAAARDFLKDFKEGDETISDAVIRYLISDPVEALVWWMEKLNKFATPDGTCLLWNGYTDKDGYGTVNIPLPTTPASNRRALAHRIAYAVLHGDLPSSDATTSADSLTLDHLCGNRSCVNAAHLSVLTQAENSALQGQERQAPSYGRIIAGYVDGEYYDKKKSA